MTYFNIIPQIMTAVQEFFISSPS